MKISVLGTLAVTSIFFSENISVASYCYREEDEVGGTCGTNGGEEERV
jgi:hypothetical protein